MKNTVTKLQAGPALNGGFEVRFPLGVVLEFYGAPFRRGDTLGSHVYKVKCATEQPGPAHAVVPCQDFGVPTERDMFAGVDQAITAAFTGKRVFAGCAGGIGRTGTFLAVVLKALYPAAVFEGNPNSKDGVYVDLVRSVYLGHAVETGDQKKLIASIDVSAIRKKIWKLWAKAVVRKYVPFFGK